jgi:hypothetical protein
VAITYHSDAVPASPKLQTLMPKLSAGSASDTERAACGRLWQMRGKRILIDHCDDPALRVCRDDPALRPA